MAKHEIDAIVINVLVVAAFLTIPFFYNSLSLSKKNIIEKRKR
jgi:hypothetical protein